MSQFKSIFPRYYSASERSASSASSAAPESAGLLTALFSTEALTVSPADRPFWYTSGKFGPYYINTHFLYGGKTAANQLLQVIEQLSDDPAALAARLRTLTREHYESDPLYREVADALCLAAGNRSFDFVSGGARRDFFFSYIVADLLGLPHLTILKDGSAYYSDASGEQTRPVADGELEGLTALHVADLVTEASSYVRAWLPTLARCGAVIRDTLAVVDRAQGGREILAGEGVSLHSLIEINPVFFRQACELDLINTQQEQQILLFGRDPDEYMRAFLREHPDFLETEAARDERTRERVERCRSLGFGA